MRKIIAALNMALDGFCDHTKLLADNEIIRHYTELLKNADSILYGRITYQLMEYWKTIVENPVDNDAMNEFALAINDISKIVFSHTLKNVEWKNSRLSSKHIEEEIAELKQEKGKDILVGSRSLIIHLLNLHLVDELQLCIHPVIAAGGLPFFKDIQDRTIIKLVNTKTFSCGAITLYYDTTTH